MVKDVPRLVAEMDQCNIRGIVNLDGRWGAELAANLARYDHAYPGRFATCCHLDWRELSEPGFGDRLAAGLRSCADAGAAGVKVWKDLGLHLRDHRGELVLPGDERLAAAWPRRVSSACRSSSTPPTRWPSSTRSMSAMSGWSSCSAVQTGRFPARVPGLRAADRQPGSARRRPPGNDLRGRARRLLRGKPGLGPPDAGELPNFHIDTAAGIAELGAPAPGHRGTWSPSPGPGPVRHRRDPVDIRVHAIYFRSCRP